MCFCCCCCWLWCRHLHHVTCGNVLKAEKTAASSCAEATTALLPPLMSWAMHHLHVHRQCMPAPFCGTAGCAAPLMLSSWVGCCMEHPGCVLTSSVHLQCSGSKCSGVCVIVLVCVWFRFTSAEAIAIQKRTAACQLCLCWLL
jgi:hypothetical protein